MKKAQVRAVELDASQCMESLRQLKHMHAGFIAENKDLGSDLQKLQKRLEDADLLRTDASAELCRDGFGEVLLRLEEIAEDQQRLYDESPALPKSEAVAQSTKTFEVKKSFEEMLSSLLGV